jgi:hypothetical protein
MARVADESKVDVDVEEVRAALRALRREEEPSLRDVLTLVGAALELSAPLVPQMVVDAVVGKYQTDGDFANGGADQFVWNQGAAAARSVAAAWRAVGALENADLLDRLAGELDAYRGEAGDAAISADPVHHFLAYRRRVGGPFFGLPEPGEELAEALVEYVLEHRDELPDPEQPLPGFAADQ